MSGFRQRAQTGVNLQVPVAYISDSRARHSLVVHFVMRIQVTFGPPVTSVWTGAPTKAKSSKWGLQHRKIHFHEKDARAGMNRTGTRALCLHSNPLTFSRTLLGPGWFSAGSGFTSFFPSFVAVS